MRYDFRARSDAAKFYNDEPSRTKQEFKASCDMNNILKKYARNGVNPFVITQSARFGDFTQTFSYDEALNFISQANESFMTLPATVRSRFDNDPGKLLAFLSDPSKLDEAVELGLVQVPNSNSSEKKSPAEPDFKGTGGASTP